MSVTFWDGGFSVDIDGKTGEFRSLDDPANQQFLNTLKSKCVAWSGHSNACKRAGGLFSCV